MRAATLTSSLAQAPVKHILYSSTRDTLSIDPANTKYAISTLSYSETPGRKYTILALHGSEFCGKMGISFKNIQSHSLGVGKLEVTDETIRQPYSSCLPSARRSWDWIHLPRSWSWISHKKRFLNKKYWKSVHNRCASLIYTLWSHMSFDIVTIWQFYWPFENLIDILTIW